MVDYTGLSGYQTAQQQLLQGQAASAGNNAAAGDITNRLHSVGDEFSNLFTNLVGRAPTDDELSQFFSQSGGSVIANSPLQRSETNPTDVRNQIAQYVGDTFQGAAKDYATQQLTAQQGQANSLADLFRTQGNSAISDTENSLLDYQTKLFNQIRPGLITSLQAQGLLNTGGMDEALAGQQADLANQGSQYIANLKLQNDQAANQISFGGASAPYYYQQGLISQQPGQLAAAGEGALAANTNTFMDNMNYQHQLGLIQAQAQAQQGLQPSFFRTLGQSFGTSMGNSMGQWFGPGAGQSSAGGQSGYGGIKALFA